jgi:probable phosphoglycerate mutase
MDLLLIRHAEPIRVENAEGPADPPLHHRGVEQAQRLASWLAGEPEPIAALWSSPLQRARQTAEPVAGATGLTLRLNEGLAEWDRLSGEYIPVEQLKAANDERWLALVSGEAMEAHVDPDTWRDSVVETFEEIVTANAGRLVAVICHGGVINAYLSWVLGLSTQNFFLPRYASISRVAAARTGQRSIVSINEIGHLRGLPAF